tara:strand:- start:1153 stop:1593 length:441 start_codon:yes stop_codon:yes gene_type:complete
MISEKVLVAVDGTENNKTAFRWICKTAKRTKSKIVATYINLIPYSEPLNAEIPQDNQGEKVLSEIEAIAIEEKLKIQTLILQGRSTGPTIVAGSNSISADTIILVPESNQEISASFDKTSKYVIRHSRCNTLIWTSNKTLDGKIAL